MKVEKISIEGIIDHIRKMVTENQKISVRGVMARSGGSPAKIMEAIKAYYEQQKQQIDGVSEELIELLMKEKVIAVEKARFEINKRIKEQDGLINELREIIVQNEIKLQKAMETEDRLIGIEAKLSVVEQNLRISNEQRDRALTEIVTLKQQLQQTNDKLKGSEAGRQDINKKMQGMVQEKQQIEQEAANLRARLEQSQEQLNTLYNKFSIK